MLNAARILIITATLFLAGLLDADASFPKTRIGNFLPSSLALTDSKDSQSTVFAYNVINRTGRTEANGQTTSYTYDDRHRLKAVSYSIDSLGNQTYSYDHAGNLPSVVEPGKNGNDLSQTY